MIILSRIIFPVPCRNVSFPHLDPESKRLAVVWKLGLRPSRERRQLLFRGVQGPAVRPV